MNTINNLQVNIIFAFFLIKLYKYYLCPFKFLLNEQNTLNCYRWCITLKDNDREQRKSDQYETKLRKEETRLIMYRRKWESSLILMAWNQDKRTWLENQRTGSIDMSKSKNLLSRPSIEINTSWESLIKKEETFKNYTAWIQKLSLEH